MKNTLDASSSFSCDIFPRCSGCTRQQDVRNPESFEEIKAFFLKAASLEPELISKEIVGWRSRAKLAVRGISSHPLIGLFEEGSHQVVDMKTCPLHCPVMNKALEAIRRLIQECEIAPYLENLHSGKLKYIQMSYSLQTSNIQLVLVWNVPELGSAEKTFVKLLYNEGLFHAIWANYHVEKSNTILSSKAWELLEGSEDFYQKIHGISFAFHPSCFAQAHLSLFEEMIHFIDSLVPHQKSILELYAGVGCIGLSLASHAKKVTLVESSPYAKSSFEKTLQNISFDIQKKCFFFSNKVEEIDMKQLDADVILVDPPRKGLSKECKGKIFESKAKQLIYVSCGYASFIRDAAEMLEKGWKIESAKGFLLFPGTNHVEIVASFLRDDALVCLQFK